MSRRSNIRRSGGGGGGGAGPPGSGGPAQLPPSDPALVEYWHGDFVSLTGGAVQSWVGQLKGVPVDTPGPTNRPVYGPDGSNFNGRSVVQFAVTGALTLSSAALVVGTLPLAGTRPYIVAILRMRAIDPANNFQCLVNMFGGGSDILIRHEAAAVSKANNPTNTSEVSRAALGTTQHFLESWADGALVHYRQDGVDATVASVQSAPNNFTVIRFGRGGNPVTDTADFSMAFVGVYDSKPSDPYIASLRAWSAAYWGTLP